MLLIYLVCFLWCVFLLPASYVPNFASVTGLSIFDCPSVFSKVYLLRIGKVASVMSLFVTLENGDMLISYFLQTSRKIIGLK